jgi:hypothetical protein
MVIYGTCDNILSVMSLVTNIRDVQVVNDDSGVYDVLDYPTESYIMSRIVRYTCSKLPLIV